jgi:hypothetical protein
MNGKVGRLRKYGQAVCIECGSDWVVKKLVVGVFFV